MKRRWFIQYSAFGSLGLLAGLGQKGLATTHAPQQNSTELALLEDQLDHWQSFSFSSIQLNRQGKEIKRPLYQAKSKVFDLGHDVFLEMVAIPPGSFRMGAAKGEKFSATSEGPQRSVQVQPFLMGKYPVTQAQWHAVAQLPKVNRDLALHPAHFQGAQHPVESVSFLEAVEFCDRLSVLTGQPYRLPSEAEWEYASRGGTTTPFAFGETVTGDVANYVSQYAYAAEVTATYPQSTTPVGQFLPNAYGIYEMHGNVWEWCADHWHDHYVGAPTDSQPWVKGGNAAWRSLRGGSWSDYPSRLRSASRSGYPAASFNRTIGFRVCAALT